MSDALLVTGATGLLGTKLGARRPIVGLPRRDPGGGAPWWEPGVAVHAAGADAVVHLAGASVDERWTPERKAAIRDSRVDGTRCLVDWVEGLETRPRVMVFASGISWYGSRGDTVLTEQSDPGTGFLAEVTHAWEAQAFRAAALGVRVVILRIGVVLSRNAGALAKMLPAFKWGVGGPIGAGDQWFPWVHVHDVVSMLEWALDTPTAQGPYNAVAPECVQQRVFAKTLGRVLGRPAFFPAPAAGLRVLFGEMADETVLASHRAQPERLTDQGFAFSHGTLEPALRDLLEG